MGKKKKKKKKKSYLRIMCTLFADFVDVLHSFYLIVLLISID